MLDAGYWMLDDSQRRYPVSRIEHQASDDAVVRKRPITITTTITTTIYIGPERT